MHTYRLKQIKLETLRMETMQALKPDHLLQQCTNTLMDSCASAD